METVARADEERPAPDRVAPAVPRLPHEPALDGLRGLAVLAVLVFHLGHLRGGFLGVDLFFVLSGYLITSLLVVEHRDQGRIDLGAFWVRRARRLLPAVLVMLAGVAVLLATLTPAADRPRFRGEALATLGYVANWQRMTADVSYWDIFSQPSPLDHTWSLAIEEQFYVVWPLVVLAVLAVGARRRLALRTDRRVRVLGVAAAVAGVVSLGLLALTYSPVDTNRAYFATDTRLGPTLLGAAMAALTVGRPRREHAPGTGTELAGVAALGVVGVSVLVVDGQGSWYYRGGLALFVAAALVLIRGVTGGPPGRLARVVSRRPLAFLGAISYGVYLWHWPVIVYLTADRARVDGVALDILQVAVTLAAALLSYRLVEQPVRRGALRGRMAGVAAVAAVATVAVAAVVVTRGPALASADDPAAIAPTDSRPYSIFPEEDEIPAGATRLLLVGDSGPIFLGPELVAEAARGDDVAVAMVSQLSCSPALVGGRTRFPDGQVVERPVCPERRREAWTRAVTRFEPDVVVYYLANAGGIGEGLVDGRWVSDCDPAFDAFLEEELLEDAELLGAGGATVVFATSPYVAMMTEGSDAEVDCRNETYRRIVAQTPGAGIIDMNAFVQAETERAGEGLLRDFVHLDERGAALVARWMLPQIPELAAAPAT